MQDRYIQQATAIGAMGAPLLHSVTDLMEWIQGGFSSVQLWMNYLAFVPLPAIMIGLYAAQRPKISTTGLLGAVLYGFAFIYFTFTTLLALNSHVATYEALWSELGHTYTVHGGLMVVGGALFGYATLAAAVFPRWTSALFLGGLGLNLLLTTLPVSDLFQTCGTALRNAGLAGMGWAIWRTVYRPWPRDSKRQGPGTVARPHRHGSKETP